MMCNSLVLTQLLLCDLVFFMFFFCWHSDASPNYIMNPKGVPTKGMWIKVFVKALPKILLFTEKCPFLNDNSPSCY